MEVEKLIVGETMKGASSLVEYGVLGILALVGIGFMFWTAYQCAKSTKAVVDNNTAAINNLKDSNATALKGVELALVKIDAKLEK